MTQMLRRSGKPMDLRLNAAARARALAAIALALSLPAFLSLTTAASAETVTVACKVVIDSKSRGNGECRVGLNGASTFIGWTGGQAYLSHDSETDDDAAQAHWTGEAGGLTPSEDLGHLTRDGDCWQGNRAQICYSDADVSAALAVEKAAAVGQNAGVGSERAESSASDGFYDDREDEGEGPGTQSGLGDAIAGLTEGRSMSCVYSEEDANRPGARMMMRGLSSRDSYQGDMPQEHGFAWDGSGTLSIDGSPSALLYHEGETVAARLMTDAPAVPSRLPDVFSEKDQAGWQEVQKYAGAMNRYVGEQTGFTDRVIILDFAKRTGTIATWLNGQLSEPQAVGCL